MEKKFLRPVIDLKETGETIRKIRLEQGFTVRDIQKVFGFEYPQAIYAWEQGKSVPTIDNLLVLSTLFGVGVEDLISTRIVENTIMESIKIKKSA